MHKSVPARPRFTTGGRGRAFAAALAAAAGVLAACSPGTVDTGDEPVERPEVSNSAAAPAQPPAQVPDSGLAADALPEVPRQGLDNCPYLDTQFVAETNGQKVTASGTDTRFDTPACVYWSYPEQPQLQVIVRHTGTPAEARSVVDWAAPVDITDPADQPSGWNGGRAGGGVVPGREGAVYAVAKDTTAVVVLTNQKESVKAQLIAEQTIANLSL